ncbi:hypothetical protein H696_03956 [Fonticula alba]|uniref:Uncharacterized protein n=1 Tax=Fonticula alba TaxID=691883 RepID=A0A058Z614_FONAL|nr:hypothetical protein H696_03956 [Fonticula alba]KCV69536.1 hypothetical protein H696_03956 [Fonticula alba]|eukprot:XP_009496101.1 hypothetical protein H696_03956 [Fonticula alba]
MSHPIQAPPTGPAALQAPLDSFREIDLTRRYPPSLQLEYVQLLHREGIFSPHQDLFKSFGFLDESSTSCRECSPVANLRLDLQQTLNGSIPGGTSLPFRVVNSSLRTAGDVAETDAFSAAQEHVSSGSMAGTSELMATCRPDTLTDRGRMGMRTLGHQLRNLYADRRLRFLPERHELGSLSVRSLSDPKAIESAVHLLQGLYPSELGATRRRAAPEAVLQPIGPPTDRPLVDIVIRDPVDETLVPEMAGCRALRAGFAEAVARVDALYAEENAFLTERVGPFLRAPDTPVVPASKAAPGAVTVTELFQGLASGHAHELLPRELRPRPSSHLSTGAGFENDDRVVDRRGKKTGAFRRGKQGPPLGETFARLENYATEASLAGVLARDASLAGLAAGPLLGDLLDDVGRVLDSREAALQAARQAGRLPVDGAGSVAVAGAAVVPGFSFTPLEEGAQYRGSVTASSAPAALARSGVTAPTHSTPMLSLYSGTEDSLVALLAALGGYDALRGPGGAPARDLPEQLAATREQPFATSPVADRPDFGAFVTFEVLRERQVTPPARLGQLASSRASDPSRVSGTGAAPLLEGSAAAAAAALAAEAAASASGNKHSADEKTTRFVRMLYNNTPIAIPACAEAARLHGFTDSISEFHPGTGLGGDPTLCPLDRFREIVTEVAAADRAKLC